MAADFGISVATNIASDMIKEYIIQPIIRHARYLFCLNELVTDLQTAKTNLESTLRSVKEREKQATIIVEKIVQRVEKWLNDVEEVLENVQKHEPSVEEVRKSYLNVKRRCSVAKLVASMTQQMNDLNNNSSFDPFSQPAELLGMRYFPSKDFQLFDCTKSAYDELMKAIEDDKSSMIGLVGMGGCGKTTLAKMVGKQVQESKPESKLFDKVVMTTVSQVPKVREIQGQIADKLSFTLKGETEAGRAEHLCQRLNTEKILLILDDVWEKPDFEAIGIPLKENGSNCSILLTTRKREVCTVTNCQSIIELSPLTDAEGWKFFKQRAQIADDSPQELRKVAEQIASRCQGLLIAIVTVGSTLKGKTFDWWESALSRLENFQTIDVPAGLKDPYACLKLSYDNLTNPLAKRLFLLCCIFPEDHEIHVEDLVRFGKWILQEPGLTSLGTMATTRREFNVAINTLIDCCLLMPTNKKECVRMHDLVRDVALWIASREGQAILVASKEIPTKLTEGETIRDTTSIYLWDLQEPELLPDQLLCPTLRSLLYHIPRGRCEIPNAQLEGRQELKVLAIIERSYSWQCYCYSSLSSILQSIGSLTNLQSLCLRGYELGDISALGSIKGLEILDLRGSSFIELPNEIGALKKLKLLDLYSCNIERNNPYEVISKCLQLQELYITTCGDYSLENVYFPKLQRYYIFLSKTSDNGFKDGQDTFLENCGALRFLLTDHEGFHASLLNNRSIKDLFLRAEGLYLKNIQESYNKIILDMVRQRMNRLTYLTLQSCSGIKCLVDTTTLANTSVNSVNVDIIQVETVFSKLAYLCLSGIHDLEELFRNPSSSCSLKMLQKLKIRNCPKLASALFTPPVAQTLVMLEELYISSCENLKYIIAEEKEEGNADCSSSQGACSMAFGQLRIFDVDGCDSLESLFPISFAQSLQRLEDLTVKGALKLNSIFGTGKEIGLSSCQNNNSNVLSIQTSMPALRSLKLGNQPNLIPICAEHYCSSTTVQVRHIVWVVTTSFGELWSQVLPTALQAFLNLEHIDVDDLERLEGIFELQVEEALGCNTNNEKTPLLLSSNMNGLSLSDLQELRFIWNGPANILSLQRLWVVTLDECPKLKTIFSATIVASLPELTHLWVKNCKELEEIISLDSEEAGQLRNLSAPSQQVCFPKLCRIIIEGCDKLKCIFSYSMARHCPSMISLSIESCSQLEQVVEFEHEAAGDEGGGRVLFPKLYWLELKSLPNLTGIFPGYDPESSRNPPVIEDCPKYRL